MDPSTVGALTFDVFGTVVDWRSSLIREAEELGRTLGLTRDWAALVDAWRALYQPLLSEVREGRRPWCKLDQLHREGLERLLPAFDLDSRGVGDREHLVAAWHRLDPWPDAVAGLQRLKSRYLLATLSNGNIRLIVDMAKRAGLPWDAVLGAEVARAYKPMPASYLTTAELLDLPPHRCLMVAAHYSDLLAAASHGFRTCYVWRRREFGDRPKDDLPAAHRLDLVVEDFHDLADRLGC